MNTPSPIGTDELTPHVRQISFSNPPANALNSETVRRLHEVVDEMLEDERVRVAIFTSGTPDFFFNHADLAEIDFFRGPADPDEIPSWIDLVVKLSTAPFVSIASIRGRTRGGGSEFALACDLRYASREKAFFGQIEVGTGLVPGGGGTDRLARLLGRDRALEVILSSADYDAVTAERFGWVTRALADDELDDFVGAIANRIASFDQAAVATAKRQVDRVTLPAEHDLRTDYAELSALISAPGFRTRAAGFGDLIATVGGEELERNLGHYLGVANQQS